VNDAGFAVDAGAFDDVVVELVALLLGDEGGHRVIQGYSSSGHDAREMGTFAIKMF
jgi:hypothetical protein